HTDLVNSLWALALHYCSMMPDYDARVAETSALLGRNLEPGRAALAVASWLTDCGVHGLSSRLEALAQADQREQPDLGTADLMALTIRALVHYSVSSVSAIKRESAEETENVFETATITAIAKRLAQDDEGDIDPETISPRRIGRIFGRRRLREKPRAGS